MQCMDVEQAAIEDRFRRAALAVVDGDLRTLRKLLAAFPSLVHERSPAPFRATLLHYVAANGVEDELQRTPDNAVDICETLLAMGAAPDALAESYGGGRNQTPLCLLVSSWHPMERGLHGQLVRALVQGGACVNGLDDDGAPLATALVFGYTGASEALAACGARIDNIFFAAGLGDLARVKTFVGPGETNTVDANTVDPVSHLSAKALGSYRSPLGEPNETHCARIAQQALHFAVTHGRTDVVDFLLARGAAANGEVAGHHCALPLLQALFVHEVAMARHLVTRGADPDREDRKRHTTARALATSRGQAEFLAALE